MKLLGHSINTVMIPTLRISLTVKMNYDTALTFMKHCPVVITIS
jgi:hypothetical protein